FPLVGSTHCQLAAAARRLRTCSPREPNAVLRTVQRRKAGRQRMLRPAGEPLRTLETLDGRTLAYAVWGDPDGFPILSLHGTPGCRLGRWPHEDLYAELGVCVVTHDRAGYGRSDRHRGRQVADEADDVRAIADVL